MKLLPDALEVLVNEFGRLPGVGARTALRYAVAMMRQGPRRMETLSKALELCQAELGHCPTCGFWVQRSLCPLCQDTSRTSRTLCVVRDAPDVLALERNRKQSWRYHVLHGLLSPLAGMGPEKIRIQELLNRICEEGVEEMILAFDATLEGDATALYLREQLRTQFPLVRLSRTALGLPAGSSVEFLDSSTLEHALSNRVNLE